MALKKSVMFKLKINGGDYGEQTVGVGKQVTDAIDSVDRHKYTLL